MAQDTLQHTVMRLERVEKDLIEFKKETIKKIDKLDDRVDHQNNEIILLKSQLTNMEKMLTKIDGTSVFIRNALITGAITLIISLIIKFAN